MTEEEWQQTSDIEAMARFLGKKVTRRKFCLLACAFIRRFWHLLTDERSRHAVETTERYVDRVVSLPVWQEALR
jgi:hypothetical protein